MDLTERDLESKATLAANEFGIMQGRLSPAKEGRPQAFPWNTWRQEFTRARALGFDAIEWLVTVEHVDENPIWTASGVEQIRAHVTASGVSVRSVCADMFISQSFTRTSEAERRSRVKALEHLIIQCASLDVSVLLVPVLERAELRTDEDVATLCESLREPLSLAEDQGLRVGLETELPVSKYLDLIERNDSPALGAYYDTGNAAAKGFDVAADIRVLGPRLFGVHIKDRKRFGPSVALGCGDVDFASVFAALDSIGYNGPVVLETPRGSDAAALAAEHLAFVRGHLKSSTRRSARA